MLGIARKVSDKLETIQEIAVKLGEGQLRALQHENGPKERTVFILGSKGVGKSAVISKFFDREENPRPTLALEYVYGRRTSGTHKQVMNVWELGSLNNAEQLIPVPMYTHGLQHFAVIIMLDLSAPQRIWLDLERIYRGLRDNGNKLLSTTQENAFRERMTERLKKDGSDIASLEPLQFPVVIVGGKYDLYMDFDPELKKHVCRCLRSVAHLIGGSLLFYSNKIPKLAKTLRDVFSHLGFGSPANPFRVHTTDYNDALSIWFGTDSWEHIGTTGALSMDDIGIALSINVPQQQIACISQTSMFIDPSKDSGFCETIIDAMRVQKDEELQAIIKESQLRGQFETIV